MLTVERCIMLLLLLPVVVVGEGVGVVLGSGSGFCEQRLPLGPSNISAFMRRLQAWPSSERKRASLAANWWAMTASSGSVLK